MTTILLKIIIIKVDLSAETVTKNAKTVTKNAKTVTKNAKTVSTLIGGMFVLNYLG
jgi:hypothetical protein